MLGILPLLAILVIQNSSCQAQQTISHGRGESIEMLEFIEVERVAVLNLAKKVMPIHVFDCSVDSEEAELSWLGVGGETLTSQSVQNSGAVRITFSIKDVTSKDLGVYTCVDSTANQNVSITIINSEAVLIPVVSSGVSVLGRSVELRVFADADPALQADEIVWTTPIGEWVINGSKFQLTDLGRRLVISNMGLGEHGQFEVSIIRKSVRGVFAAIASEFIATQIYVGAVVVYNPISLRAWESGNATFSCTSRGNPLPTITWNITQFGSMVSSEQMTVTTRQHKIAEGTGLFTVTSDLLLTNIQTEMDQWSFSCEATNTLLGDKASQDASTPAILSVARNTFLVVQQPSELEIDSTNILELRTGITLKIGCLGFGEHRWMRNESGNLPFIVDESMAGPGEAVQFSNSTTDTQFLLIDGFLDVHAGVYTCVSDSTLLGVTPPGVSMFITIGNEKPVIFIEDGPTIHSNRGGMASISASSIGSGETEWYFQGERINAESNPRYSLNGPLTLQVLNVDTDLLGTYEAVIRNEAGSTRFSIFLQFAAPPIASVDPRSYSFVEGETAYIMCDASGTDPAIIWSKTDTPSLPSGVFQLGNTLGINQPSSLHQGSYSCTAVNVAGERSDTFQITKSLSVLYIAHYGTAEVVSGESFRVVTEQDTSAPTFLCFTRAAVPPTLTWQKLSGNGTFPSGVTQRVPIDLRGGTGLVWGRSLHYTDTGQYSCNSSTGAIVMDLLVTYSLDVTVTPRRPFITGSAPNYRLPPRYSGVALTCKVLGWPVPTVQWLINGEAFEGDSRVNTEIMRDEMNDLRTTTMLIWLLESSDDDDGTYTCMASNSEMSVSQTVMLRIRRETEECGVTTRTVFFQLRVLDTACEEIDIINLLLSLIRVRCPDCKATSDHVKVSTGTCSEEVEGATLVRGTVVGNSISQTEGIVCVLESWQQFGPTISLNTSLHLVDAECPFRSTSPTGPECSNTLFELRVILVGALVGGVVLVALLLMGTIGFLYWFFYMRSHLPEFIDEIDPEVGNIVSPTGLFSEHPVLASLPAHLALYEGEMERRTQTPRGYGLEEGEGRRGLEEGEGRRGLEEGEGGRGLEEGEGRRGLEEGEGEEDEETTRGRKGRKERRGSRRKSTTGRRGRRRSCLTIETLDQHSNYPQYERGSASRRVEMWHEDSSRHKHHTRPPSRGHSRPSSRPSSRPPSRPPSRSGSRPPSRSGSRPPSRSGSRSPSRPPSRASSRPVSRSSSRHSRHRHAHHRPRHYHRRYHHSSSGRHSPRERDKPQQRRRSFFSHSRTTLQSSSSRRKHSRSKRKGSGNSSDKQDTDSKQLQGKHMQAKFSDQKREQEPLPVKEESTASGSSSFAEESRTDATSSLADSASESEPTTFTAASEMSEDTTATEQTTDDT